MTSNQNKPLKTRSTSTSSSTGSGRKEDSDSVTTVNDLWIKMQAMFNDSNERLEAKIDTCMEGLNKRMDSIEEKLAISKQECDNKVANVSEHIDRVRSDLADTNRRMDYFGKTHELILSGVPYLTNEDLRRVFRNIASNLGYHGDDVPTAILKRLSRYPIVPGASPPILCEFAMRTARDDFYRSYLQRRSLTLRHIGFDSTNRVYINENLTPAVRQIRAEALKLKKEGRLLKVFTKDGVVYVKSDEASEAVAVYSIDELH